MRQSTEIPHIFHVKVDPGTFSPFIPASWPMMVWPRSSSTRPLACSQLVFLVNMQLVLCSLRLVAGPQLGIMVGIDVAALVVDIGRLVSLR